MFLVSATLCCCPPLNCGGIYPLNRKPTRSNDSFICDSESDFENLSSKQYLRFCFTVCCATVSAKHLLLNYLVLCDVGQIGFHISWRFSDNLDQLEKRKFGEACLCFRYWGYHRYLSRQTRNRTCRWYDKESCLSSKTKRNCDRGKDHHDEG